MKTVSKTPEILFTGIGSLPHPNIDSALAYSFRHSLPFLPQIPLRNPWEYMIPQALENLPGLEVDAQGMAQIHLARWTSGAHRFRRTLEETLAGEPLNPSLLEKFEPSPAASSCWRPFLWELQERNASRAKIQLCGPLTAKRSLRLTTGEPALARAPELSPVVFRLILARALAMSLRLREVLPELELTFFFDEPAVFTLNPQSPADLADLTELRILVQTLQKQGIRVGIHCCSEAPWNVLLETLHPDYLSLDADRSLASFLSQRDGKPSEGTRLALGVVPTDQRADPTASGNVSLKRLKGASLLAATSLLPSESSRTRSVSGSAPRATTPTLLTPACGLALLSPEDAEESLRLLEELQTLLKSGLADRDLF